MRIRGGAALLGLLLAGCSLAQAQPATTFSVKPVGDAIVRGVPPQLALMAAQFLSAKVGFMAVAETSWTSAPAADVHVREMLATSDAGASWTRHALPEGVSVTGIDFLDPLHGFLVGKTKNQAELWATANGSQTWQLRLARPLATKPYRESLDRVSVGQGGQGFALLDGGLYRTGDGGASWQAAALPSRANDVLFLSPTIGLAVSDRTIWRTADAGRAWQAVWQLPASLFIPDTYYLTASEIDVPSGMTASPPTGANLLAASGSTAWAVFNEGAGCAMPHCRSDLVLSQDGGEHWQLKVQGDSNGNTGWAAPTPVVTQMAASRQGLYAVADSGSDLGLVPGDGSPRSVFLQPVGVQVSTVSIDGQGGVWLAAPNAGLLYRSATGTSFAPVWPPLAPTMGIQYATREVGYGMAMVAGRLTLLVTRDGGHSWQIGHAFSGIVPSGFAFTSARVGYVFGTVMSPSTIQGQVLRTADGGRTWHVVRRIGDASGWLGGVSLQVFSRQEVLQGLPQVRLSRDGGKSWHTTGRGPVSGPQAELATWFLSPRQGWALDARTGELYRTASGGAGWRKVGRLPSSNFASIEFVNPQDGWVLGTGYVGRQKLLRTTDGGMRWSEETLPQSFGLVMYGLPSRALSFVSPRVGYLDTNSGVYKTDDGGRTWSLVR